MLPFVFFVFFMNPTNVRSWIFYTIELRAFTKLKKHKINSKVGLFAAFELNQARIADVQLQYRFS